jgi:hypothetical protein
VHRIVGPQLEGDQVELRALPDEYGDVAGVAGAAGVLDDHSGPGQCPDVEDHVTPHDVVAALSSEP